MSCVFFFGLAKFSKMFLREKGLKFEGLGDENTTFVNHGIELSNKRLIICRFCHGACWVFMNQWMMMAEQQKHMENVMTWHCWKTIVDLESVPNNDHSSLEHHQIESRRSLTTLCSGTNIATEAWLSYIFRTLPANLARSHQTKVKTSFTTPPFLQVLREFSDFFSNKTSSMDSMVHWILKMPTQKKRKRKEKRIAARQSSPRGKRLVIKLLGVKAVSESSCHGSSLEHSIGNPWICDTFQTRRGNGLWKQKFG